MSDRPLHKLLTEAAAKKGLSIRDVAEQADCVYEHARTILNGERMPKSMTDKLERICDAVGLDPDKISAEYRISRKGAK